MSIALTSGLGAAPASGVSGIVEGAVDVFDAAARLESRGVGDAIATSRGYADVFALAADIRPGSAQATPARQAAADQPSAHGGFARAWSRAAVLLAGVLVCLPLIPTTGPLPLFLTAATGWLTAQVASAGLWWGIGRAQPAAGARLALTFVTPIVVVATFVAALTGWWETPLWAMWGATAAAANTLWPSRRWAAPTLVGSLAVAAPLALPASEWQRWPAVALVLVMGGWTYLHLLRLAGTTKAPTGAGLPLVGWSVATALALQGLLAVLVVTQGDRFAVIASAGVVAGIVCEPVLEQVGRRVRATAATSAHWGRARRRMVAEGVLWTVAVGVLSIGAAAVVSWLLFDSPVDPVAASSAFGLGSLSAAVGLFMRSGSAAGAARASLLGAIAVFGANALLLHDPVAYGALLVGSTLGLVLLASQRLALPAAW